MKEDIRRIVEDEEELNYQKRMGKQWVADLGRLKTDWNKPYLTKAPYIVLLFKQSYGLSEDGQQKITHYYNEISTSISAGNKTSTVEILELASVQQRPLPFNLV